ncbi:hypothetical protein [Sphaerisporangium sp. TRM90804]|uniref:hypothetical protein n=1 Tax=Sphaerisporangium sp. TRM90804 TaxID=3031113 RepID=UPI002449AAD8|nr:hypothetical protein [Sphaerisporangium sp. TRM90804]MDH2430302.1 hypothetical protein [Sphaerisporangium sp. TRM90804]
MIDERTAAHDHRDDGAGRLKDGSRGGDRHNPEPDEITITGPGPLRPVVGCHQVYSGSRDGPPAGRR